VVDDQDEVASRAADDQHRPEVLYVLAGLPVGVLGLSYVLVARGIGAGLAAAFLGLPLIAWTPARCPVVWPNGCSG
jgi:hypothetical protein